MLAADSVRNPNEFGSQKSSGSKEANVSYYSEGQAMPEAIRKAIKTAEVQDESSFLEQRWMCTYSRGVAGRLKLLHYDVKKLVRFGAFPSLLVKGTIFTMDSTIWMMLFAQLVVAVAAGAIASQDADFTPMDIMGLTHLSEYLGAFVPFVLGLYISLVLSRWWSLRTEALGPVYNAMSNVCMMLSGTLPCIAQYNAFKEQILKYMMCSVKLMVRAARNKSDIDDLLEFGYLTQAELDLVKPADLYQRAMIMWCWVMRLTYHVFEENKLPWGIYDHVVRECISARDGINTIHTFLHTQVPFAYVHLINLIVNLNNIIVSVRSGMLFQFHLRTYINGTNTSADFWQLVTAFVTWFTVPVLYHGLLAISYVVHDPFGEDLLDFPIASFTEYVYDSCKSFYVAQDCPAESKLFGHTERVQRVKNQDQVRHTEHHEVFKRKLTVMGDSMAPPQRKPKDASGKAATSTLSDSQASQSDSADARGSGLGEPPPEAPRQPTTIERMLPMLSDLTALLGALEAKLPDTDAAREARLRVERAEMQALTKFENQGAERQRRLMADAQPKEVNSCVPLLNVTVKKAEEHYLETCSF